MDNKSLYSNFPESLRSLKQWIVWRKETKTDGKPTKVPYQTNGRKAATTRPEEWATFDECIAVVDQYSGIGFVFYEGVVGLDLDHCINPDGLVAGWARDILNRFNSYTERSPSGDGLHIILESDVPLKGKKLDHVECYTSGRFFTVTGEVFEGRQLLQDCDVLDWYRETFGEEEDAEECPVSTNLPDDGKIKSVMFGSKNGAKMRTLYEQGDWKSYQEFTSQSQADMSLVGTLMFFCCNDRKTVDRLFRKSALFRDKWDDKHGARTYGEMTMDKSARPEVMKWKNFEGYMMSGGKNPVPLLILENIYRAFNSDTELNNRFRLNDFSHMIEVKKGEEWGNLQDYDVLEAQRYVSTRFECFARVSKEIIVDTIRCMAYDHKVNPQREYFEGLVWDGTSRVNNWLTTVFGTPDDELHRAMGSNWLKGLVKRVMEPGCIFDEVLVLEGKQGMRKSTSLRVLGRPWHTESTLSTDDKDFYMLLARNVIVEFSEGEIIGRTSAQKLKAIITKTEDTFRPPYEHGMMTFKRSCVFAMTTNNGDYQKDETGGRRWLPIVLGKVADTEWLEANRDQLFAEAIYRVRELGETTHEYPQDELMSIQEEKMEEDVYDEPVKEWYEALPEHSREQGIRLIDIYELVIMEGKEFKGTIDKRLEWRIGGILRRVLRLKKVNVKRDGQVIKRWLPER